MLVRASAGRLLWLQLSTSSHGRRLFAERLFIANKGNSRRLQSAPRRKGFGTYGKGFCCRVSTQPANRLPWHFRRLSAPGNPVHRLVRSEMNTRENAQSSPREYVACGFGKMKKERKQDKFCDARVVHEW